MNCTIWLHKCMQLRLYALSSTSDNVFIIYTLRLVMSWLRRGVYFST